MWERQYETARWSGQELNLLSTAIDGGKRLQTSELPYVDLPHIKVMGSKARTFKFDVVFVGAASLSDANALIESLEANPIGEFEHPWLGELNLTYETFSQSFNTKRGLVTLGLSFVRSGITPTISTPTVIRSKDYATTAEELSTEEFANDVAEMGVDEITQTQTDFRSALGVLSDISNRLTMAEDTLTEINTTMNEAYSSVNSISNMPKRFANLFTRATTLIASAVHSDSGSASAAINISRNAQSSMLSQVKTDATTNHHNLQMTTAAVRMSTDLTDIEKEETYDVTTATTQPEIIQSDLTALLYGVNERIEEVTQVSTLESMALFDSLISLQGNIQASYDKLVDGCEPHRTLEQPKYRPALTLAHEQFANEKVTTAINPLQHPLFLRGSVAIREE